MSGMTITADLAGLDANIDDMAREIYNSSRPAAQAGVQVLYDRVKQNVGRLGKKTGNLDRSIYQVFSKENSAGNVAEYQVGWNSKKAPHAGLVEGGYIQRYEMGIDESGKFFGPIVRPEMRGQPKPGRRASQAAKDAYYMPRQGGPKQVAAKPFLREAESQFEAALDAAEAVIFKDPQ